MNEEKKIKDDNMNFKKRKRNFIMKISYFKCKNFNKVSTNSNNSYSLL